MPATVITGSTRGIGFGLAREFLKRGYQVAVSGQSQSSVDKALAQLSGLGDVVGLPADIRQYDQLQALWDKAFGAFGRVDIWINNAAISPDRHNLADLPVADIESTVRANLTGSMFGTRVALTGMLAQGSGKIYMFEGFGSNGMTTPGLTTYGSTKYAIRYFTTSVAKEYKDSPVLIGSLSPGMVVTDLLVASTRLPTEEETQRARKVINILADKVEVVTPWLVDQAIGNDKQNAKIQWLTRGKAARRFMGSMFSKRDVIGEVEREAAAGSGG